MRFDFWIPEKKILIEYQGRQHELGWGGSKEDAEAIKFRDKVKFQYAKKNGFTLLLIDTRSEMEIHKILKENINLVVQRALTKQELDKIKNLGGWTKERAFADAKNYNTRKEWDSASHGYSYARLNGFLEDACAHMLRANAWTSSRKKKWEKDNVINDAKKYSRPGEWKKNSPSAYAIALRNGWHSEATLHMAKK